jgi:hypothetical protein
MSMNTKAIVGAAALMCGAGAASYWLGYLQGRSSTNRSPNALNAPAGSTATDKFNRPMPLSPPSPEVLPQQAQAWDYKTVEAEMSESDLRQRMQDWSREGWMVLSISKPLRQPDGTILRRSELRRARQ